jgi:hypothetical protein
MTEAERRERVILLACNLDDMTGEELGHALELMLTLGALDAWHTPIVMKKSRPAVEFSVLSRLEQAETLREALLTHTSTLGVRWQELERLACERRVVTVGTPWGAVRCKVKLLGGRVLGVKAEYEDCASVARQHAVALRDVAREAERLAWQMV